VYVCALTLMVFEGGGGLTERALAIAAVIVLHGLAALQGLMSSPVA
jgi:hypothetical protein